MLMRQTWQFGFCFECSFDKRFNELSDAEYLVGILGVFTLLYGLDPLFSLIAADETALGYLLRYIRYGATTFWVMFGAPWVFLKLNLATSKNDTRRRH